MSSHECSRPLAIRERYTLIYDEFIPYLVGAVQSLTKKIEALEEEKKN